MAVRRRAGLLWRRGGPHPLPQGPTPLRHRSTEHSRVPDRSTRDGPRYWSQGALQESRLPTGSSKSPGVTGRGGRRCSLRSETSLTNVQAAVPEGVVSLPGHLARCHRGLDRHASKITRQDGIALCGAQRSPAPSRLDRMLKGSASHGRTNRVVYRGRSPPGRGISQAG